MKNYFIIAGAGDTPFDNWYNSVRVELINRGFNVVVPFMPNGDFSNYKAWERVLNSYVRIGQINKQTTIIAHDSACAFVGKFIAKNHVNINGIIAVSPFNTMLGAAVDKLTKSFICKNEILAKTEKYVKFYHAITSTNDPVIADAVFDKFIEVTGAKPHKIEAAGHFSTESGYNTFPELVSLIEEINKIV